MKYEFLPELFLRAPFYSFTDYDLNALAEILQLAEFKNALYLASPDFYLVLEKKGFDHKLLSEKEIFSLYKYYNRMCFRTTPFGSFSSFTNVSWTGDKIIKLGEDQHVKLHLSFDQNIRVQIFKYLSQQADNYNVMLNPMCYRVGNNFRFIKTIKDNIGHNLFTLDSIAAEDLNIAIVNLLKNAPLNNGYFLSWIENAAGCTNDEAQGYLNFLLTEQFLYTENNGNVIDIEDQDFSGKHYANLPLSTIINFAETIRTTTINHINPLPETSGSLKELLNEIDIPADEQLFYSACERPLESGGIDICQQKQLLEAVEVLRRISAPQTLPSLEKFIADFKVRFDQEKVPLLIALDPDTGIGYGDLIDEQSGLHDLEDIRFPTPKEEAKAVKWSQVHQLMLKLWLMNPERGPYAPLLLTDTDLLDLGNKDTTHLPPTTALMFRKTQSKLLIDSLGGSTATSLIGRFSVFSDDVVELNRKLAKAESVANPDILFADIGQLSDLHVDNINRRMRVYDYEIPVNVYSVLPIDQQIRPDDLLVSVLNNELILESTKLKRRVIPRFTSAYNHTKTDLTLFRFLCDLQHHGIKSNFSFDLEHLFPGLDFYPSIEYEDMIISPAKWILKEKDLSQLKIQFAKQPIEAVARFRKLFNIPKWVMLGNTDQQLIFNLENAIEASFFIDCLKGEKRIILKEFIRPDHTVVVDDKPFVNQFVAFLKHDATVYQPLRFREELDLRTAQRSFIPGSSWFYLKLFCTPQNADLLLINIIKPIVDNNQARIHKWFFIRYTNNGNHLRFRVNAAVQDQALILSQIKELLELNNEKHLIKSYQIDTYQREIERYGSDIIDEVETIFCAGSELVTAYLDLVFNKSAMLSSFQLGVLIITKMTEVAWDNIDNQINFLKKVTDNFMNEFSADKPLKIDLDKKYRQLNSDIKKVFENDILIQTGDCELLQRLTFFLKNWRSLAGQIPAQQRLVSLLADLIHMQINRLFSTDQRKYELLLYYCTLKYLQSQKVRIENRKLPLVFEIEKN